MATEVTTEKRKRGRPKKVSVEENPSAVTEKKNAPLVMSKSQEKKTLSVPDVQRSLTALFREVMQNSGVNDSNRVAGFLDLNSYNPFLQNERLKALSSNPVPYSPEEIANALQQPQYNEEILKQSSAALSASQYLYYKILREAADIPLFKYFVIPPLLKSEEYKKETFLQEEEFVDEWLECFDVANTLKRVGLEVKREGKVSYVFRQRLTEEKKPNGKIQKTPCYVAWQKLPPRYVKLTAIGEHGYITSFNLMLFLQPGFSPSQYPDFIQAIWEDMLKKQVVTKDKRTQELVPDLNALRSYTYNGPYGVIRGNPEITKERYMYWVQLPQDMCFSFASDTSNAWSVPDTMGLFSALQELTDYSTLAGLIASTPLTAVLTGEAEFVPQAEVGQDQTCLSPSTLESFKNAFDSMTSGNISSFFAPLKNLKLQSLPNVPNSSDIKTKAVQNFVSTAGDGGLIAATDKPSVAMIKGAQLQAASQYDFVTRQFQTIINDNLRKHTGLKYKWRVVLWGDIFTFDGAVKTMKEMVAGGASFLLPKLASAYDLTMREVRGIGEYVDAFKVYDKFKSLNYVMSKAKAENTVKIPETKQSVGRPALEDDEVENDNTAASKDAGNNVSDTKEFALNHVCILCGDAVEDGHVLCASCEEEYEVEEE